MNVSPSLFYFFCDVRLNSLEYSQQCWCTMPLLILMCKISSLINIFDILVPSLGLFFLPMLVKRHLPHNLDIIVYIIKTKRDRMLE